MGGGGGQVVGVSCEGVIMNVIEDAGVDDLWGSGKGSAL